jgi:hypothetical protein
MTASKSKMEFSRREFLLTLGAAAPTLSLLPAAAGETSSAAAAFADWGNSAKFASVDITPYFNSSSRDFGPREIGYRLEYENRCPHLTHLCTGSGKRLVLAGGSDLLPEPH